MTPVEYETVMTRNPSGLCELGCGRRATDWHHRNPKRAGGTSNPNINRTSNGLALCSHCHHWVVHEHPAIAYHMGWLVHSWDDETLVPVWISNIIAPRWWLLVDNGGLAFPAECPAVDEGALVTLGLSVYV